MSEEQAAVLVEVRNQIGHLILNRPAGLNALTLEMIRLLQQQLDLWRKDPEIRAVVLRANGEKAFCAGGDIRALYDSFKAGDDLHTIFFEEEYALDQAIHDYSKPILALMDGFVLGGGMGLVQGASHRVITERTRMGMPETGIGYFPDVGGSYFLSRLRGETGAYLGVTGTQVRAADALYTGLADFCLGTELLSELDRTLNTQTWSDAPGEDFTTILKQFASTSLPGSEIKAIQPAIDRHFAHDSLLDIRASLATEECDAYMDWAQKTLSVLETRSPLAMSVTLEMIRRGRELNLEQCFELELHLDRQWFAKGDIVEGVRALIIDKDKSPRWNPPTLDELSSGQVARFFEGFAPSSASMRRQA